MHHIIALTVIVIAFSVSSALGQMRILPEAMDELSKPNF